MTQNGSIELIIGPMFAGKSSELLRKMKRYYLSGKKCIIIAHKIDNRYENSITHNNETSKIDLVKLVELSKFEYENYDVIGIDEIQFFDDCEIINNWANNNKLIICAGLDADSNLRPFGKILNLIVISEKVYKLSAICRCGLDASFTLKNIKNNTLIEVGGIDKYHPVCRNCYYK